MTIRLGQIRQSGYECVCVCVFDDQCSIEEISDVVDEGCCGC